MSAIARIWRFLRSFLDDALPMPPGQRQERDWTPESDAARSERQRLGIRMKMLEKRGKGGYR